MKKGIGIAMNAKKTAKIMKGKFGGKGLLGMKKKNAS